MEEPKLSCPAIDRSLEVLCDLMYHINRLDDCYYREDYAEVITDIIFQADILCEKIEEIRVINSELRNYGNYWKERHST